MKWGGEEHVSGLEKQVKALQMQLHIVERINGELIKTERRDIAAAVLQGLYAGRAGVWDTGIEEYFAGVAVRSADHLIAALQAIKKKDTGAK